MTAEIQGSILPFHEEDYLSPTGERIVSDRYLLKDTKKETLSVGSIVVAVVDKKRAYHELARVVEVDAAKKQVKVELRDGFQLELPVDQVDVLKETSPRQMWQRIARGAAHVTNDPKFWEQRFYELQSGWKYVPGGRINASLGTGVQTTSYNCFVIPNVGPTPRDYAISFGQTLEIQARSGGVGMNLSQVPPQGSLTPVREVRKTDLQLVLDVWHADLLDFLSEAYPNSTKVVRVSREFLRAVEEDADWTFLFPDTTVEGYDDIWNGNLIEWMENGYPVVQGETVKAGSLYEKILESGVVVVQDVIGLSLVPGDRRGTIASTLGDMWEAMARGKRVSVILSSLRPRYSYVRGVNGRSSGAYSWGNLYDKGNYVFAQGFGPVGVGEIMSVGCQLTLQGGSRRGALMLILNDRHADIRKFITCKQVDGVITGANLSVGVSEEFMAAKATGDVWKLGYPHLEDMMDFDGDFQKWEACGHELVVYEELKAEELWDEMMESAWKSAEPGVVFLGRYNFMSNSNYFNPIIATNPCFHPDTRISTEFGLIRIEDLYKKVGDEQFLTVTDRRVSEEVKVVNGRSYALPGTSLRKAIVFPTGTRKTLTLTLKNGMELKVTPEHRILTVDGWKEAQHLTVKDEVYLQSGEGKFAESDGLGRDWGLFLGWLTGDGWISKRGDVGMVFGRDEAEVIPKMIEIGQKLCGAEAKVFERETGSFQVFWWRKELLDRLLELGVKAVREPEKEVPESIFTASRETVVAFLQALFSADGTVYVQDENHRAARLTSASKKLLQGVQLLLLNFGIHGKIYDRAKMNQASFTYETVTGEQRTYESNRFYELMISGNNLVVFQEEIGFELVSRKQMALESIARPSRNSEKFISQVESITEGETVTVYDITEPVTHSLVANGVVVHNCGEQGLPAYGICNLGAVVLSRFAVGFKDCGEKVEFQNAMLEAQIREELNKRFDEEQTEFLLHHIKWEELEKTVRIGLRFQDAVIDATYYPFEENRRNQMAERRVGLGIMGLHDLMIYCGITYGSDESTRFIDVLLGMMAEWCYLESVELAKENGPFPMFDAELYLQSGYMKQLAKEKPHVTEAIRKYGVRNVTTMTIAPTGTTGTMVGCSTGCEPYYAWSYYRNSRLGMFEENAKIVDDYFKAHPDQEELPEYFVTAMDLTPEEHVRVQAALQKWIDSSISKTCNAPNSYTVEDTKKLYDLAYELGCKGVTIYRDGSRSEQVLSLKEEKAEQKEQKQAEIKELSPEEILAQANQSYQRKPRPDVLYGATYKKDTPLGSAYITINDDPETGLAREVFVNIGKAGSDVYASNVALGRAITLYLADSQNPNKEAELVKTFSGIGGSGSVGFGERRITSVPDAIAKSLIEHSETFPLRHLDTLLAGKEVACCGEANGNGNGRKSLREYNIGKDYCPQCHQHTLVRQGGCNECEACGFSKC
jgi:ribonucleoside-diphosphate reductase alpha chain